MERGGMIYLDTAYYMQKLNIEKRIFDIHPYKITEPKEEKGRYQTYVKRKEGKRLIIRASTYEKLIQKLFEFYFCDTFYKDKHTLQDLFDEWIKYKESITESPNTIRRHEQHWNKYFKESWGKRKLGSFDKIELQKQCNVLVKENNLTSKEWQNLKTILSGIFMYAYEKGYIDKNPLENMKISVKFKQVNKKSGSEEVFNSTECKMLNKYFEEQYNGSKDPVWLCLKFDMCIGLRVGELAALTWADVVGLKNLHVCKEEIRQSTRTENGWSDEYMIVDHTKTHQDRMIPLVPKAVAILNRLRISGKHNENDYIFEREGERLTTRQITYALEKACEALDIPVKRTHKIRKTVASKLNSGNVPLDAIREFLGHSTTQTTFRYIYNPLTEKETYDKMSEAL